MSHQTGIRASQDLLALFADAKNEQSSVRVIKVTIDTTSDPEQLVESGRDDVNGTWENDFGKICPMVQDKEACYIFYKFDRKADDQNTKWLFVMYIPDNSPPKSKMLYASTKSTCKSEFGGKQFIADEVNPSTKAELTLDGYEAHVEHKAAPVPLSMDELEIQRIKESEIRADVNVDSKHQTMQGVAFPLSEDAMDALQSLKDGRVTFVQLNLDLVKETIELSDTNTCDVNSLSSHIPEGTSRYNFFCFKHQYEGDYKEDVVFIYSMGGYSSPIKERMLFSSGKAPCLSVVEDHLGIPLVKKVEIDSTEKITADSMMDIVHPIRSVHKPKFDRPKGPGGRSGARRIIKNTDN
ncbi:twinfilin-1-like [Amphiura filiformis]|uniref:twinfilin-1-like n=1 Tax=Amphiura filiformis TaxID=82378 RepID=UPI003B216BE3